MQSLNTDLNCKYDKICGSCSFSLPYYEQLNYKKNHFSTQLNEHLKLQKIECFSSFKNHFRIRAEFRIFKTDDDIFYALVGKDKKLFCIDSCKIVSRQIHFLMPRLLQAIKLNNTLKQRLFGVEFISSQKDKLLVTLIYHKEINDFLAQNAKILAQNLDIFIILRSKGKRLVINQDYTSQKVLGKTYFYTENSFIQPNLHVNKKMLLWLKKSLKIYQNSQSDLLELYCGFGNFTFGLCEYFNNILATEVSKTSIKIAQKISENNHINNIKFLRMDVRDLALAFANVREFKRLKMQDINLNSYNFKAVLVDPPRSGLDKQSIELIQNFETIIYISCNQESLKKDLEFLPKHYVQKAAVFDQFAYTKHLESILILRLKNEFC